MRLAVLLAQSISARSLLRPCRNRRPQRPPQPAPPPRFSSNPAQSTLRRPLSFMLKAPSPCACASLPLAPFRYSASSATSATALATPPFAPFRPLASSRPPMHPVIRPTGKALSTSPFSSPAEKLIFVL